MVQVSTCVRVKSVDTNTARRRQVHGQKRHTDASRGYKGVMRMKAIVVLTWVENKRLR